MRDDDYLCVCVCVLQHLRVRCTEGAGFFTRSCTRVKGKMGHRFMFIDGDKALSGSYRWVYFYVSTLVCVRVFVFVCMREPVGHEVTERNRLSLHAPPSLWPSEHWI